MGGSFRKLRDGAWLASPSPNGTEVAFIAPDPNEIWLMGPNGEDPHRLVPTEKGSIFAQVGWSPDSQRVAYLKDHWEQNETLLESRELRSGQTSVILSDRRLRGFWWAPDGRVVYPLIESQPGAASFNLWEIRTNPRSGRASGEPERITSWAGYSVFSLSTTADGKRLAFVRSYDQSDVYVGRLEANGTRLKGPRRLTLDDRMDWPGGWTRDSKTILFYSDRQGQLNIFRQGVGDRNAEVAAMGPEEMRLPQLSPDGAWILYLAWPKAQPGVSPTSGRLMRIPVSGGPPELVLEVKGYPGSAQVPRAPFILTAVGHPSFRCPSLPEKSCALSERDGSQVVFSAFDPVQGRKGELVKLPAGSASIWDLSPDGTRIVFGEFLGSSGHLHIVPLAGGTPREVDLQERAFPISLGWSADGTALFLTGISPSGGSLLLRLALDGHTQVLYKSATWLERPIASPDGRHLAFGEVTSNSNAWMIANF